MRNPIALIIDDEASIRELIQLTLERMGIKSDTAKDIAEAMRLLNKQSYTFCLTDMRLPDGDGLELVTYLQQYFPEVPVAVITAFGNVELAVTALKAGAFDFVSKPVNLEILRTLVTSALQLAKHIRTPFVEPTFKLIGHSLIIENLRQMIKKLARSQAPVLLYGASGTGKELVARLIHAEGPRADGPFIPVNCGAIPSELMESEFFGYKKGSFTGASVDREGLFQAANQGTLFLDEIAELPLAMQVKLLRVMQEKAVRPIGSQKEIPVNVRILSATHKDLNTCVANGEFRQDLFYRINVIRLDVPSLAERVEDIPLLAQHILTRLAMNMKRSPCSLDQEAVELLMQYPFPGNVRELENILERTLIFCEGALIMADDLQLPIFGRDNQTVADLAQTLPQGTPLPTYLDQIEREAILSVLEKNQWNKTKTAETLGLTLRSLRYRLKKLNLE